MRALAALALLACAGPASAADPAAARLVDALRLSPPQMRLIGASAQEAEAARAAEREAVAAQERRLLEVGRTLLRRADSREVLAPEWLQRRWHEADRARDEARARARQRLRALAARVHAGLRPGQLAALDECTHYAFPPAQGSLDERPEAYSFYSRFLDQARAASGGPAGLRDLAGRMRAKLEYGLPPGFPVDRAALERRLFQAAAQARALPEARYAAQRDALAKRLRDQVVPGRPELDARARIASFLLQRAVALILEGRLAAEI
ncbi:MAG: hypothetical protein HY926_03015 [Elusimicrobia bacterium]|nr:hypothetical protein [Elusimicrobiota bacterium]